MLYGTVARLRVKPGKEQELLGLAQGQTADIPGLVFDCVFRMDSDPRDLMLVVGFESKEAYRKNAGSPEQHARYEQMRAMLDADPEWHDGEIIRQQMR